MIDQPHPEISYQCPVPFGPRSHHWQGPACENGKECPGAGSCSCHPPRRANRGAPVSPGLSFWAVHSSFSSELRGKSSRAVRESFPLLKDGKVLRERRPRSTDDAWLTVCWDLCSELPYKASYSNTAEMTPGSYKLPPIL